MSQSVLIMARGLDPSVVCTPIANIGEKLSILRCMIRKALTTTVLGPAIPL